MHKQKELPEALHSCLSGWGGHIYGFSTFSKVTPLILHWFVVWLIHILRRTWCRFSFFSSTIVYSIFIILVIHITGDQIKQTFVKDRKNLKWVSQLGQRPPTKNSNTHVCMAWVPIMNKTEIFEVKRFKFGANSKMQFINWSFVT